MQVKLRAALSLLAMLACAGVSAADKHLGVATCAGSACHGAARMEGGNVRQDEYLLWQRRDQHSRAFATLRTERSRRIAANLGLPDATGASTCLTCHADEVATAQRGGRFQLSDGVGCETCHGGAERWLNPHVRGYASHAQRLAAGLYPTWEPAARAQLCLSCHQGDARRPMTHAIMGAGHPPLLFELDTFVALQPAHYEPDADYTRRKGRPDTARNWATGQLIAARELLAGIAAMPAGGPAQGVFPELAWFNCNACHHPMQPVRWEPNAATGLAPGRVRLADVALHQSGVWMGVVNPELATNWRKAVRELHQASQRSLGEVRERATAAHQLLDAEALPLAGRHQTTRAELRELALQVIDGAGGARATDFAVAEQAAMAIAVFVTALEAPGATPPTPVNAAIDAVYAVVADREKYEPGRMRQALGQARAAIATAYK